MKKYIMPDMQVIMLTQMNVIAASPVEKGFDTDEPIGETDATSGNLSRQDYNAWGDEEEEL